MKDYNHEIKCLHDLSYRHANIECHGGYGNNPSVTMLSRTSVIYKGFIRKVDVNYVGTDENGEKLYDNYLIIDSEYGHEIKLPYEKIIGMTILSSEEQAFLEMCNLKEEQWKQDDINWRKLMTDEKATDEIIDVANKLIEATEHALLKRDNLIAKGVKTFK